MEWRTRDGQVFDIRDMEDGHLVNTIRFVRKHADRYAYLEWESGEIPTTTESWMSDEGKFELLPFRQLPPSFKFYVGGELIDLLNMKFFFMCNEADRRGLNYVYNRKDESYMPREKGYNFEWWGR